MYILRIIRLTTQRDMQMLVKALLRVPDLGSAQISNGLKFPPFEVLSVEQEQQAQSLKTSLEKFGAVCEIENTKLRKQYRLANQQAISAKKEEKRYKQKIFFWSMIFSVVLFFIFATYVSDGISAAKTLPAPKQTQSKSQPKSQSQPQSQSLDVRNTGELKKELTKNPYNPDAWKTLSENLEEEGDTVGSRAAKESYEKAVRTQMVLASLAKSFGNNVRVEVTEDAVYYRTSYNFTDSKFYDEASKLRDALSVRFKGKRLIIENYTPNNKVQRVELDPNKN